MGKSKISEKIITQHKFGIEGLLNVDNLDEGIIIVEVEEEGEIDLSKFLKKFSDKYVKISISETLLPHSSTKFNFS